MPAWITWTALKALPWRLIGIVAAILAATGLIWGAINRYGDSRAEAARVAVQTRWDAETARLIEAANAKKLENEKADAADAARNLEIENAHAKELAAATADTDRYRRLLARSRAASSGSGTSEGPGVPATPDPGQEGSASPSGALAEYAAAIDSAIADVMVESRQNASQLDALIAEIVPQM